MSRRSCGWQSSSLHSDTRILIFSVDDSRYHVGRALETGADDGVLKDEVDRLFLEASNTVISNTGYMCEELQPA